jgi:hypothetical protein
MDDVKTAVRDLSQDALHTITPILMGLLVLTILLTVLCSALIAISKRQEMMLDELLRRSGNMQDTLVLSNPKTRYQGASIQHGRES